MAERAWAELAAALKPGDDRVGGQRLGSRDGHIVGPLVADLRGDQPGVELFVAESAAQVSARHRLDRVAQAVRDVQRRAQRGAGVPRGGLHPELVERPLRGQAGSWPRS